MKVVFLVCNEVFTPRVMEMLNGSGIDYYTRWEQVKGKGHGTDPHLGTRSFPGMNAVLMIAFQEEVALEQLVQRISEANEHITRADDRIRLFQVPLERII
jgi:nitrogen regulatory protein PII